MKYKSLYKLNKLSDDQLFSYFVSHARYMPDAPLNGGYTILCGGNHIHSHDTKDLFEKFVKRVRTFEAPILTHIWEVGMICKKCDVQAKKNKDGSIAAEALVEPCPVRMEEYKRA